MNEGAKPLALLMIGGGAFITSVIAGAICALLMRNGTGVPQVPHDSATTPVEVKEDAANKARIIGLWTQEVTHNGWGDRGGLQTEFTAGNTVLTGSDAETYVVTKNLLLIAGRYIKQCYEIEFTGPDEFILKPVGMYDRFEGRWKRVDNPAARAAAKNQLSIADSLWLENAPKSVRAYKSLAKSESFRMLEIGERARVYGRIIEYEADYSDLNDAIRWAKEAIADDAVGRAISFSSAKAKAVWSRAANSD